MKNQFIATLSALILTGFASSASASTHAAFVCDSADKSIASGVYMFAYDKDGSITNGKKAGFCELTVDNSGNAYGQYFCWVADTLTAKTKDGQLAIQFVSSRGDGAVLLTQLNLPANLLQAREGSGLKRILSRSTKDLTVPIRASASGVTAIDCKLQNVSFAD